MAQLEMVIVGDSKLGGKIWKYKAPDDIQEKVNNGEMDMPEVYTKIYDSSVRGSINFNSSLNPPP